MTLVTRRPFPNNDTKSLQVVKLIANEKFVHWTSNQHHSPYSDDVPKKFVSSFVNTNPNDTSYKKSLPK